LRILARFRQRQASRAKRLLGLFVVVWLSMALLPCAMALGSTHQHDGENCLPEMSGETLSADAHELQNEVVQDERCNISGAQCAFLNDYNYDGRATPAKVKHAPSDAPIVLAQSVAAMPLLNGVPMICNTDDPTRRPGNQLQIHLLYCVYHI